MHTEEEKEVRDVLFTVSTSTPTNKVIVDAVIDKHCYWKLTLPLKVLIIARTSEVASARAQVRGYIIQGQVSKLKDKNIEHKYQKDRYRQTPDKHKRTE